MAEPQKPPRHPQLRQLICMRCGLDNTGPTWSLVEGEWVHLCTASDDVEEDPTPVTVDNPADWTPPKRYG